MASEPVRSVWPIAVAVAAGALGYVILALAAVPPAVGVPLAVLAAGGALLSAG
ncbi:hypothetical protein [Catenuloplanes atrovinosus]|uniref:Uncharacterized protein n=1 Tax=Catenuloplanes atrovinosus TaxID=137266 RepID=A0AAE4C6S5_9ACTN|nr:hypothetical protein [Catenuloplanes atrovinosus]MDR7273836.1 hypothetical protein [Catenuloplanes atrovinosus]